MAIALNTIKTANKTIPLRVAKGHFATSHSHINYYIDLAETKHRVAEAKEAARQLAANYKSNTVVDTILCLDGTETIGTCMALELAKSGLHTINRNSNINVVTPEHTTGSQLLFRENIVPMIQGKHVIILAASITTGFTVQGGIEAVKYYGGMTVGVCSIVAFMDECFGYPVTSIFQTRDVLEDYMSKPFSECPLCKQGVKVEAIVNTHGISSF